MPHPELEALRVEIDAIDEQLVELLARRFAVTARVGAVKKRFALQPVDAEREARQLSRYRALAARHTLDPEFVGRLFRSIFEEVVINHGKI
jgi:chorismate mutase